MSMKEGPLTPRQTRIIELVSSGVRHKEVARTIGVNLGVVGHEITLITRKMNAQTAFQAVYLYARAQAFMDASTYVADTGHVKGAPEGAEKHANEVVETLARALYDRGMSALPK